ncbi:MAG: hypothetical protein QOI83_2556 [Streptomycetaceae bacterium]|jgi:hypothetical protein|nr:hypothetical protein [Streptomycetaceae bacterium]
MSRRYGGNHAATTIAIIADAAALILGVWIVMYLLDANQANELVNFIHRAANWLSGWSRGLFTPDEAWLRTVLNYGLPAVVYLFIGHVLAGRVNRA